MYQIFYSISYHQDVSSICLCLCNSDPADLSPRSEVPTNSGGTRGFIQRKLKEAGRLENDESTKLFYNHSLAMVENVEVHVAAIFGEAHREAARLLLRELHGVPESTEVALKAPVHHEKDATEQLEAEESAFRARFLYKLELLFGESHKEAVRRFIEQVEVRSEN
jgi:hypothetical protein